MTEFSIEKKRKRKKKYDSNTFKNLSLTLLFHTYTKTLIVQKPCLVYIFCHILFIQYVEWSTDTFINLLISLLNLLYID